MLLPLYGILFGAVGAVVGLFLGLLCSLVLFAMTRISYYPRPSDAESYVRAAGRVCSATSALALLTEWVLHGLFDQYSGFLRPYHFIVWRMLGGNGIPVTAAFDLTTMVNLTTMVVIPTLLFSLAMRWAGRRVAAGYAREVGGTISEDHSPAAVEGSEAN